MIRLLIGKSDKVVFLNESMFSRVDYDKNKQQVYVSGFSKEGIEECLLSYSNVKEVDYIQDGKFFEHIHNVIHYQDVFC